MDIPFGAGGSINGKCQKRKIKIDTWRVKMVSEVLKRVKLESLLLQHMKVQNLEMKPRQ